MGAIIGAIVSDASVRIGRSYIHLLFPRVLDVLLSPVPLNMFLQYKKVGRWNDYFYWEYGYVALSIVVKTALAWQVFAGKLRQSRVGGNSPIVRDRR